MAKCVILVDVIVVVHPRLTSSVIRRVDINYVYHPSVSCLKHVQSVKVVAFDENMCWVSRFAGYIKRWLGLQNRYLITKLRFNFFWNIPPDETKTLR